MVPSGDGTTQVVASPGPSALVAGNPTAIVDRKTSLQPWFRTLSGNGSALRRDADAWNDPDDLSTRAGVMSGRSRCAQEGNT
ncbi:hypothetical protein MTO96_010990 [Rhipicephalus appendiculatus]